MLSIDFFNSNYCQTKEVPKFIDAKGKNRSGKKAIYVPVALEHQHLEHVPKKFKQRVIAFHEGADELKKSWRQLCEEGIESEKEAFSIASRMKSLRRRRRWRGRTPRLTVRHQAGVISGGVLRMRFMNWPGPSRRILTRSDAPKCAQSTWGRSTARMRLD